MNLIRNLISNFLSGNFCRRGLVWGALLGALDCFGQAPIISYISPPAYTVNSTITTLIPNNTGGPVPTAFTGTVSTFSSAGYNITTSVATDADYVYVCDWGNNLVKKVHLTTGVVTVVAGTGAQGTNNGAANTATFYEPDGVVLDASGNLYVSDQGNNLIRKITPDGIVSTLAGSGAAAATDAIGTAASFNNPRGLAIDPSGNIYVADQANNLIRKITQAGVVTTIGGNSFNSPTGVGIDVSGVLYVADAGSNSIKKISTSGVVTTFATGLSFPREIRIDKDGTCYVTNQTSNSIAKISPAGVVSILASGGFTSPIGLALNALGILYIADSGSSSVKKVIISSYTIDKQLPTGLVFDQTNGQISGTPTAASLATVYTITANNASGSSTTTVTIKVDAAPVVATPPDISYNTPNVYTAGTAITPLQPTNNGGAVPLKAYGQVTDFPVAPTGFNQPTSLAFDAAGNLYVTELGKKVISKITPVGVVSVFAGQANVSGNIDGDKTTTATFGAPSGIAFDSHGNMFVADNTNHTIRKIDAVTNMVTTFAGTSGVSGFANNNIGILAQFKQPYGLAIDAADNIYVADQGNNAIRMVSPSGAVTTLAGTGFPGNQNGPVNTATLRGPMYVAVDGQGAVYVNDQIIGIVRVIANGMVDTRAGININVSGSPYGMRTDAFGNLYFAGKNQIFKLTRNGDLISLAGNTSGNAGPNNGIGSAAGFSQPVDIMIDNTGDIYIADKGNNRLRKLAMTGYAIDKALPPGLTFDGTTGTISGTPTVPFEITNYTITAYNASGSSATFVTLQVDGPSKPAKILPPQISYESPQTLSPGSNFVSLAPTNTGGAVPAAIYGTKTNIDPGLGRPTAVAADPYGNVYVTMTNGNQIKRIDAATGAVTIVAGTGATGQTNGPYNKSNFSGPIGITLDSFGNIYVADQNNNSIRKITPAGDVSTFAGSILGTAGAGDGYRNAATFRAPRGITIDASDNIYIADFDNNLIRKIDAQSGLVSTLYDASPPGNLLKTPSGVGVDASGVLYIADAGNNRIQRVGNGPATTVLSPTGALKSPRDVKVDGTGNLYVTDQGNNRVVRISPDNVVTTVATFAPTQTVVGAVLDGLGNLYIGDNEYKVVKIAVSGYEIDKPLPAGLTFDVKTGIIGGTPTVPTPMQTYTITAYNGGGSNTFPLELEVANTSATTITFNTPALITNADNTVTPSVATNNTEAPVIYTSNNPAVISVDANGVLHRVGPGTVTITASQLATAHYTAGAKTYTETFKSTQQIVFPAMAAKTICSTDFSSGATSATSATHPITYTSSNTAVATIDNNGIIHIVHAGNTTITASQVGDANFYDAAVPVSRALVVTSNLLPIVSVTASNGVIKNDLNICVGSPVTFTAAVSNLALLTNPTYQWQVNGSNVGTNSNTYTSSSITATDIVKCTVTTNDGACSAFGFGTSPPLTLIPMSALSVTIQSSVTGAICPGTPVTFTATPSAGGANVIYQWKLNGNNVGTNSNTYASNSFVNGDVVSCTFTNNSTPCIISNTANSNTLTVSVTAPANPAPTVTIAASVNNIYENTPITFTAAPLNTTGTVTYQWQVNGNDAGTNNPTFTSSTFINGDKVTCTILSGGCAAPATSAPVTITIKPPLQILPPTAFTPNGDGINDLWTISGLLSYPNCLVNIYSRNGELVYQSKGYAKPWDGAINGKNLPVGTYYYVIDLNSNNKPKVSGYIAIIR